MPTAPGPALRSTFGEIDIYLFDQLLKGRFDARPRVLDAGCGDGRNLRYLLAQGFSCWAADRDPAAVAHVRHLAGCPGLADRHPDRFHVADVDPPALARRRPSIAVICSAVLHFADDAAHFERMVGEPWRVLARQGPLLRASGLEHRSSRRSTRSGRPSRAPARRTRIVRGGRGDAAHSLHRAASAARLADPLKTTVVQGMRAMTTWCVTTWVMSVPSRRFSAWHTRQFVRRQPPPAGTLCAPRGPSTRNQSASRQAYGAPTKW